MPVELNELDLSKRVNFLLGKNGCGKSTVLRELENRLRGRNDYYAKYITPERGGSLTYDATVDQNVVGAANWLGETRRKNRFEQFRQQTVSQYRTLELAVLREIEADEKLRLDMNYTFENVLDDINSLLPLVKLSRGPGGGFEIFRKSNGQKLAPDQISSGESEAIALAIEALVFSGECQDRLNRLLLIDEPDVHLHPDLQSKLMRFFERLAKDRKFNVVIATHSTALVGSIADKNDAQLAFMPLAADVKIKFSPIDEIVTTLVPIFGAHPLSNVFNEHPILLVEGDDDKRVWEQAIRSTAGKLSIWPCPTGSVDNLIIWERWLADNLPSLYDEPRAFSLRDRDDSPGGELADFGVVTRLRLQCRASENLMLADDTLALTERKWDTIIADCRQWLNSNPEHPKLKEMKQFADSGFDRLNANVKEIRNVLLAMLGVSRPWEVLVGQTIAKVVNGDALSGNHSLKTYLGEKVCIKLLKV